MTTRCPSRALGGLAAQPNLIRSRPGTDHSARVRPQNTNVRAFVRLLGSRGSQCCGDRPGQRMCVAQRPVAVLPKSGQLGRSLLGILGVACDEEPVVSGCQSAGMGGAVEALLITQYL